MNLQESIGRRLWDLDRFGLSPRKAKLRFLPEAGAKPVFFTSVPKSGTHLLERIICLRPGFYRPLVRTLQSRNIAAHGGWTHVLDHPRRGQVYVTHAYFEDEIEQVTNAHGYAKLLMVRDPRAMVLSYIHHIITDTKHEKHAMAKGMSVAERIDFAIHAKVFAEGMTYLDTINRFLPWRQAANLKICQFEALVGEKNAVADELEAILTHIGSRATPDEIAGLAASMRSSKSPTFRKGSTNEWEDVLSASQIAEIEIVCGEFIDAFGYQRRAAIAA